MNTLILMKNKYKINTLIIIIYFCTRKLNVFFDHLTLHFNI